MSDPEIEELLPRISDRVYPQHLQQFSTTLLKIQDAKFHQLMANAGEDSWKRGYYVLRQWYQDSTGGVEVLYRLLKEAERMQFIEQGTLKSVVTEEVWQNGYLQKSHSGPYPDFAALVAPWYTDITWENMLLFPWMDEDALLLSESHSDMEMVSYEGRYRKMKVVPLKGHLDLFNNIKPQGTRILVRGDPGTGKTTFVDKLALDSAKGRLEEFDVVFVVKLKFSEKTQTIAEMVKGQIRSIWEETEVTPEVIEEFMKSGHQRVLLVLDGVDEIDLEEFPKVKDVLYGREYRKCCILATTRPYVAETLNNKMTLISNITGFSREKAKEFVSNFLDTDEMREFFRQLDSRRISEMYRIPMLLQAMALLFRHEAQQLPVTFTETYDQLVFFLGETCKERKTLSEEKISAATEEVNELAFRGLTRKDKQLIFSRGEIKNSNSLKLGTLTGVKGGGGFRPITVLQFLHNTLQEYHVADHVVEKLGQDHREPWDILKQQIWRESQADSTNQEQQQKQRQKSSPFGPTKSKVKKVQHQQREESSTNNKIENNYKTLLKFIVGKLFQKLSHQKLPENFVLAILNEMGDLMVEICCEKNPQLSYSVLESFMEELMLEGEGYEGTPDIVDAVMGSTFQKYQELKLDKQ